MEKSVVPDYKSLALANEIICTETFFVIINTTDLCLLVQSMTCNFSPSFN